jgi:hypothetical protein
MAQINPLLHVFHNEVGVQNRKQWNWINSLGVWRSGSREELSCDHNATLAIQTLRTACNKHKLDQSTPLNHWKKGWNFATSVIYGREKTQIMREETQLATIGVWLSLYKPWSSKWSTPPPVHNSFTLLLTWDTRSSLKGHWSRSCTTP